MLLDVHCALVADLTLLTLRLSLLTFSCLLCCLGLIFATVLNRLSQHQTPSTSDHRNLEVANRQTFENLKSKRPDIFVDYGDRLKIDAEPFRDGAQGQIFAATLDGLCDRYVVKVLKNCPRVEDLQGKWPLQILFDAKLSENATHFGPGGDGAMSTETHYCTTLAATMLPGGRFAFVMHRYWGDLRMLIDLRMKENGYQASPFESSKARTIMRQVAVGLCNLHRYGILHKDVKPDNVLLRGVSLRCGGFAWFPADFDPQKSDDFACDVADFDSPLDTCGTKFFQAPEVLCALLNSKAGMCEEDLKKIWAEVWTEKVDVFSYGMTCYEILTGYRPFQGVNDKAVSDDDIRLGKRPPFPEYFHPVLRDFLDMCWHQDPARRPTMTKVVAFLESEDFYLYGSATGEDSLEPAEATIQPLSELNVDGLWSDDMPFDVHCERLSTTQTELQLSFLSILFSWFEWSQ